MKGHFKWNIAIFIISLIVGCILLEVVIRLFGLAPEVIRIEVNKPYGIFVESNNPRLKYELKPNTGYINEHGLRDYSYSIIKPKNVFRIIVLGDSFGFGFCRYNGEVLALKDIFAKVLERGLGKIKFSSFEKIEVINFSVSGYDIIQEVELLRMKGLVMKPDLVIVAYCLNDSFDCSVELDEFRQKGLHKIAAIFKQCYLKSHLFRLIDYRFGLLRNKDNSIIKKGPIMLSKVLSRIRKFKDFNTDRPKLGFKKLKRLSLSYDFKTLIVIFPYISDFNNYKWISDHEQGQKEAENNNFYCLDLFPIFKDASDGNYKTLEGRCQSHPNELGHRVAAVAIQEYILDNALIE